MATSALQPIYNVATQYRQGGLVTWASNTTLTVSALLCRSFQDNLDINIGDYFGENTGPSNTTINGAVVGLNGLDTGTLGSNKVYAIYAIADQAGYNAPGFILSLSTTGPQMPDGIFPSGYNAFRRIGWAVTNNSSQFYVLTQSGQGSVVQYNYATPPTALSSGSATTQTTVNLADWVPSIPNLNILLNGVFVPTAAAQTGTIQVTGTSSSGLEDAVIGQVASVQIARLFDTISTLSGGNASIDYKVSNGAAGLSILVLGWREYFL